MIEALAGIALGAVGLVLMAGGFAVLWWEQSGRREWERRWERLDYEETRERRRAYFERRKGGKR